MWTAGVEGGPTPAPRAGELAGTALQLVRSHYRALLSAVAVVLVPSVTLGAAALALWHSESGARGGDSGLARLAEIVGFVLLVLGSFLAQAAGAQAVTSAMVGAAPDWRSSLRVAYAHRSSVLGAGLAVAVFASVGLMLFIFPGVVLWLTWFVTMPVVVLEGAGVRDALRKSAGLVVGRRPTILGAFVLLEILVLACTLCAGAIAGVVFAHVSDGRVAAEQVVAFVVEILVAPLQVTLVTVVYLDQRARREGVSPHDVARAVGIDVPPGGAGRAGAPVATPGRYGGPPYGASSWGPPSGAPERWEPPAPVADPPHDERPPSWPAVSPKPGAERTVLPRPTPWPGVSPKPVPPTRRMASPPSEQSPPASEVATPPRTDVPSDGRGQQPEDEPEP